MDTAENTHGMDGALVKPDWPRLAIEEVRALLAQFPRRREPLDILSVSPRPFSAASVVATRDGPVFIKRHQRAIRDRESLLEEHRFLEYLWARGAAVPRVLAAASSETAIEMGEWTYEVHETPVGVDLYGGAISWTPFLTAQHAHAAGRSLAELHRASLGYSAPPRNARPLIGSFSIFAAHDPAAEMAHYLSAHPVLAADAETRSACDEALELLAPFHAELLPSLPALEPLWTHNDLHASNLFWSDASDRASVTAIFDFGLADRTNAVHDVAIAIERNIVEWLTLVNDPSNPENVKIHFDHLDAMLDGYEEIRPLTDEEAAALAPMTALCHAEFALTEADYFLGVLHSAENARTATKGYIVLHSRWFHSAAGRRLLDRLRAWAGARRERIQEVVRR
jgi:Ser/Thr protein kinase RdoA (MazF antagonist)